MRRWLIVALVSLFTLPAFSQDLALKRVMLSSGGLGYFEYEAAVEGDATLKLTVSLDQVDDVLKSLVVYDDKGGVGGLSLPGKEPLRQTFRDMPFDQSALDSPAALLGALKGAQISVGGTRAVSGRIVSVEEETQTIHDGKATTKRTRVAVLTDTGLQQFILEDAENLQFADAALRDKIGQALQAIQANRAKDTRTLDLATRGQAPSRTARAGRLHRHRAGVEGLVPAHLAGRCGIAEGRPAGLGHRRESQRTGLEGGRADAGLGPSGRVPPGAVRSLLRHAAGSAGRGGGPAHPLYRSRRRSGERGAAWRGPPAAAGTHGGAHDEVA